VVQPTCDNDSDRESAKDYEARKAEVKAETFLAGFKELVAITRINNESL